MDFAVYFYPQSTFVFPMPRIDGPLCPPIRKRLAGQRAGIEPGPYKISGNTMPNWEYFYMTVFTENASFSGTLPLPYCVMRHYYQPPFCARQQIGKALFIAVLNDSIFSLCKNTPNSASCSRIFCRGWALSRPVVLQGVSEWAGTEARPFEALGTQK